MANEKFKIKGKKNIPGYDTDLEVEVDNQYEAYSKTVPDPTPYEGGQITWFNAFGVRKKSTGKDEDVTYKVTLERPPAGKRLFALYGGRPHELTTEPGDGGKIKFTLNVGDPPIGSGP